MSLTGRICSGPWSKVWGEEGGARGLEVTDTSEDTILPHLTTDNPICSGEPSGEPAFNAQVWLPIDLTKRSVMF